MKITFVDAARSCWGAEQSLVTLALALKQQGHEPFLICYGDELASLWRSSVGTRAVDIRPGQQDPTPSSTRDMLRLAVTRAIPKDTDAVVLFSHFLSPAVPVLRIRQFLSGRWRRRIVIDLHDQLTAARGRASLAIGASAADRVIAVSDYTARQLGRLRHKSIALHRPVEGARAAAARASTPCERFVAGIIGRLDPEKHHEVLGDAISRTESPIMMVVRGAESPYAPGYEKELRQRLNERLGDRVRFEGKVRAEDALEGIDVLVVCNEAEPMGRTVIEAQLAGIPAVVPDEGGAAELVEDGVTGLRYRAGAASALADALDRLATDPYLRERLSRTGRERAMVSADPEAYARAYVAALLS
jgi:glycosyltransferase involved in cell wall biosynthesis